MWSSEDALGIVTPDLVSLAEAMSAGERKQADGEGTASAFSGLLAAAKQRELQSLREVAGGTGGPGGVARVLGGSVGKGNRSRSAASPSSSLSGVVNLKDATGPWKVCVGVCVGYVMCVRLRASNARLQ